MKKMIMNRNIVSKNQKSKKCMKESLKAYGKSSKPVIKGKIGKVTRCVGFEDNNFQSDCGENKSAGNLGIEEYLEILKCGDLAGFGGGFSVYEKTKTFLASTEINKVMIVNGVECEPGLHTDHELVQKQFDYLINAVDSISRIHGIEKVIFAAKSFPDGADGKGIELVKVPYRYPMGEEHVLIKQVLGFDFPKNVIPAQKGILVHNVQTVSSIYKMICGEAVDGRFVTLSDLDNGLSKVMYVKYGENIKDKLLKVFECASGTGLDFYAGSGIFAAEKIESKMFDSSVAYACISRNAASLSNENRCKGCGRCQAACPMKIKIKSIVAMKEKNISSDISSFDVSKCIHCGTCAFVCRANKIPFEYFV